MDKYLRKIPQASWEEMIELVQQISKFGTNFIEFEKIFGESLSHFSNKTQIIVKIVYFYQFFTFKNSDSFYDQLEMDINSFGMKSSTKYGLNRYLQVLEDYSANFIYGSKDGLTQVEVVQFDFRFPAAVKFFKGVIDVPFFPNSYWI